MHERISSYEAEVLRDLASQVSEIAKDPKWNEKVELWTKLNSLEKTRPMILCPPQGAWEEMIPTTSLQVKDSFFQYYENRFRQQIFRYKHLRDDEVIDNKLYIPYVLRYTDWIEGRQRPFDKRPDHSAAFKPEIIEPSDLKKMQMCDFEIDEEASKENFAIAHELFDDYLEVIEGAPYMDNTDDFIIGHGTSMVDVWLELRGMDNFLCDFIFEPELVKDAMEFLTEGTIRYLKKGIEKGIWKLNNDGYVKDSVSAIGPNGLTFCKELPGDNFDGNVKLENLWGYAMAQECTTIGPDMLEEFILPYQKRVLDLFGLNCYGCCENQDKKWDAVRRWIPRLREVSVTAYCNFEHAIKTLEDKYVLCLKPKPADVVLTFDKEKIKNDLINLMSMAKDSHVCINLRELETVKNEPQRIQYWIDTAMELAEKYS